MADNKIYRTFKVGGDPTKIAFLASDLSDTVNNIQSSGWTIERIDSINNTSAWDFHKQKYVSTTEYIIIAYRNACEESTKETEQPKNQYKIGQKVRVTNHMSRYYDECGYIEDISYKIRFDNFRYTSTFIGDSLECVGSTKETEKPKNKLRYLFSQEHTEELIRIADEASERMLADHHCRTCKHSELVPHYEKGEEDGTDDFCKLCNRLVLDYYEGGNCKNYEVKDEYK